MRQTFASYSAPKCLAWTTISICAFGWLVISWVQDPHFFTTSRYSFYGLLAVLGAPWMVALAVMLTVRALTGHGRAISISDSKLVLRFPFRARTLDVADIVLVSSSKYKTDSAKFVEAPNPLKLPTQIEVPQVRIDLRDGKQVFFRSSLLRERAHDIAYSLSQVLHTEFGEDI